MAGSQEDNQDRPIRPGTEAYYKIMQGRSPSEQRELDAIIRDQMPASEVSTLEAIARGYDRAKATRHQSGLMSGYESEMQAAIARGAGRIEKTKIRSKWRAKGLRI